MAEIIHELPIEADTSQLYSMLIEEELLSRWWLPGAKIEPKEGAIGNFPLSDGKEQIALQVLLLVPNKRVIWQCLKHKFPEWKDTRISFEISGSQTASVLRFQHSGWRDTGRVFAKTSYYWASLYLRNLKQILETSPA